MGFPLGNFGKAVPRFYSAPGAHGIENKGVTFGAPVAISWGCGGSEPRNPLGD